MNAAVASVAVSVALLHGAIAPGELAAQRMPGRLVGKASERFVGVAAIREISATKAIVLDTADQLVMLIDFETGKSVPIGRTGDGPGEYRRAIGLFALGGDTTIVDDQRTGRWIVVVGERITATIQVTGRKSVRLSGADTLGHILDVLPYAFRRSTGVPYVPSVGTADSLLVIRRYLASGFGTQGRSLGPRADTVARLRGISAVQTIVWRERPPPASRWLLENPLVGSDEVALLKDGWIALLRREPYRVDWVDPRGVLEEGTVIESEFPRITTEWKSAFTRRRWPAAEPPIGPHEVPPWPDRLPPFVNQALVTLGEGVIAVRRLTPPPFLATRYDVVSRASGKIATLELPARARIVGASPRYLYVVTQDDDDVEVLSRYLRSEEGRAARRSDEQPVCVGPILLAYARPQGAGLLWPPRLLPSSDAARGGLERWRGPRPDRRCRSQALSCAACGATSAGDAGAPPRPVRDFDFRW